MPRHYIFGALVEKESLTREEVEDLLDRGEEMKGIIHSFPVLKILRIFSKLRTRWQSPDYPLRREAVEKLPPLIRFHPSMLELGLTALTDLLKAEHLNRKLLIELGGKEFLDGWRYKPDLKGYLLAQPLGVVLHVAPGNVFVSAVDSLIHGLLTKNVNILKLSREDPLFPLLFAQSLKEADPEGVLSSSFSIIDFRGGEEEIQETLKRRCNAIVVWGGRDTVESYRNNLPVDTSLIEYGPKYSFSILTREGLSLLPLSRVCKELASDIVLWEQRACSAPQVIYLEQRNGDLSTGQLIPPTEFLRCLAEHLEILSHQLPQAPLSLDEKVEMTRARERGRFEEACGDGLLMIPEESTAWTIIYEQSPEYRISPLNRAVYVKPYRNLEEILRSMEGFGPYLQSVGILAAPAETTEIAGKLASLGATRFTEIGRMGKESLGAPHDGKYQLQQLIKWVAIERERTSQEIFLEEELDLLSPLLWEKLREVVEYAAQRSPYYREAFKGKKLERWEDLQHLPLLSSQTLKENSPPYGTAILTGKLQNAYVFSSGGTTSSPKFIAYYYDELDEGTTLLAKVYKIAGLGRGDIVANLFMAGNLWTSFIAVNKALEEIGCLNLPVAGNTPIEQVVQYIQLFRVNAVLGIPSVLIRLAEHCEQNGKQITLKTILYGGEHMAPEALQYLKRIFNAGRVVSAGYASVDAGPVGYQCHACSGGVHHILTDYQFMELLDLETGRSFLCPSPSTPHGAHGHPDRDSAAVGEIVITNLSRHLQPVIRYRTGDLGRWVPGHCPCGRGSPRFELLGRCDERIRVGTVDVYPDRIDEAIARVPGLSHIFQIIAKKGRKKDLLVIRVEEVRSRPLSRPGARSPGASIEQSPQQQEEELEATRRRQQDLVVSYLLEGNPELQEALQKGWLGELKVEVVRTGKISRIERTGKILRVIDERRQRGGP